MTEKEFVRIALIRIHKLELFYALNNKPQFNERIQEACQYIKEAYGILEQLSDEMEHLKD